MSGTNPENFSCEGCGKSYRWKPEFAGRRIKCKCGTVMVAPAAAAVEPQSEDEPDFDALYSLAAEGKQAEKAGAAVVGVRCPSCRAQLEPGAAACPQCGFNLRTGKKSPVTPAASPAGAAKVAAAGGGAVAAAPPGPASAFQAFGGSRRRPEPEKSQDFKATEIYLPLGLLLVGIVLSVMHYMQFFVTNEPLSQALVYTFVRLGISFALMVAGLMFLIRTAEMSLGHPGMAVVKIAAIISGPVAIADIISFVIHDPQPFGMGLVGFFLAFGMFFIAYHYLFEFDMSEKWLIVTLTCAVCMILTPIIFRVAVFANPQSLATKGAENDDAAVENVIALGRAKDCREWLDGSGGRLFGDFTREDTEALYTAIHDAGATQIMVAPIGPNAAEVYVKMPSNAQKRKAVINAIAAWDSKNKRTAPTDDGGKWLIIPFMAYDRPMPIGF